MLQQPLRLCVGLFLLTAAAAAAQEPAKFVLKATLGRAVNRTMADHLTALARDGSQLAYRSGPDAIAIVEPLTGKLIRTITIQDKEVGERLFYSPDGKHLVFQAMQQVRLVDPATGKVSRRIGDGGTFDFHRHDFHWNADVSRLTDVEQNFHFDFKPKLKVWDGIAPKILGEIEVAPNGGHRCEAISGDGSLIAAGGRFHKKQKETDENVTEYVELWETLTRQRKGRIHLGKDAYAVMLGLSANGKHLVTVTENQDGAVIWDTGAGNKVAALGRFPGGYGRIVFAPDDKHFAIQAQRGYTVVYETATGRKTADLQIASEVPAGVGFTPAGDVVTCFANRMQISVGVVNRKEQPALPESEGHTQPVFLTRFADDGKSVLTVGRDLRVIRWDAATGKRLETLIDESGRTVFFVDEASTFTADGRLLALATSGDVALYDLAARKKIADLRTKDPKYHTRFSQIRFTADGKKLIARGEAQERNRNDFKIVIVGCAAAWSTETGALVAEYSGGNRGGEQLLAKHFAKEPLAPLPAPAQSGPRVEVGAAIRDPWASPRNAGPLSVGNQLTLTDPVSKTVLFDRVLSLNGGRGISISPDGKKIALPLLDNTVQILELP